MLLSFLHSQQGCLKPSPELAQTNAHAVPGLVSEKDLPHDQALNAVANAGYIAEVTNIRGAPSQQDFDRLLRGAIAAELNRQRVEEMRRAYFAHLEWQDSFLHTRQMLEEGRASEADRYLGGLGIPARLRTPYLAALQNHLRSYPLPYE